MALITLLWIRGGFFYPRLYAFCVILLNNLQLSILSILTFIFVKRVKYLVYNFVLKSTL